MSGYDFRTLAEMQAVSREARALLATIPRENKAKIRVPHTPPPRRSSKAEKKKVRRERTRTKLSKQEQMQ